LLGGAVIKIGSQQLDSSLAGKLSRLKIALQAA
jgi:F0F1-type ATP synthase delta subunit